MLGKNNGLEKIDSMVMHGRQLKWSNNACMDGGRKIIERLDAWVEGQKGERREETKKHMHGMRQMLVYHVAV